MSVTQNHELQPASSEQTLTSDELRKIDAYWRACNYLCAGMIYLRENPLLRQPLRPEHFKNRLAGALGVRPWTDLHLGSPESRDHASTTWT